MFAYCNNNPVNYVDYTGKLTVTFSIGADLTFFFFGVSESVSISFDDDFNIAVQISYSEPNYLSNNETFHIGLMDVGVCAALQMTEDDTVYDLEGPTSYAGFSGGNASYIGGDLVYSGHHPMKDDTPDTLTGLQGCIGYGIGLDAHYKTTQTKTLWSFNLLR